MSFACSGKKRERGEVSERLRQITFFRVSQVSEHCTGIFTVSNARTKLCNKKMEEKAGFKKQNSKKGSKE